MTRESASIRRLIEDAELARSEVVYNWRKAEGERKEQLERQIERLDNKIERLENQFEEAC